jgi:hypothetical protein
MTRRLRIISFIAALGCFAFAAGVYRLGFELWPPAPRWPMEGPCPSNQKDVEACLKGRILAWLGTAAGTTIGEPAERTCHYMEP